MVPEVIVLDPQSVAEKAVAVIGCGYDLSTDIRLSACKSGPSGSGSRLIVLDQSLTRDLVLPGGIIVRDVSSSIKCDKGERTRFCSDVLSFNQVILCFDSFLVSLGVSVFDTLLRFPFYLDAQKIVGPKKERNL